MTDLALYREREREARDRAEAASSDNLRAIYNRIAVRYAALAACCEIEANALSSKD